MSSSPHSTSRSIWVSADFQAVFFHRLQNLAVDRLRPAMEIEKPRHGRAVNVGIEDADLEIVGLKPERDVDGRGRLADAALAGSDRDDRADARHAALTLAVGGRRMRRRPRRRCGGVARSGCGRPWRGGALRHRRLHAAALLFGGQRDHGPGDARHRLDRTLGGGSQRLHLAGALGRHRDREEHLGICNEDVGDQAQIDDVAGEIRPVDGPEALDDGFLGDGHLFGSFCSRLGFR
jgi:hypothetical protein